MRPIYQDSDIIAAGERLRAERPSGAVSSWDVLKAVGGRGKLERVERIWTAHLQDSVEAAATPPIGETPLPPRLSEARDADLARIATSLEGVREIVASLYGSIWSIADGVAQNRVAAERQVFADQRDEFERREALARELQADSELREDALEARADGLDQELALARTDATRLTERLKAAEAEAARAAERSAAEAKQLSASLDSTEATLSEARCEVATATATAAAAQAEAERSRSETAAIRHDLEVAGGALAEARREAAAASALAPAVQAEAERARAETTAIRLELEEVRAEKSDLSTRLATAEAKVAAMAGELDRERQMTATAAEVARGDMDRLRQDLEAAQAGKAGVEASLAALEARAEVVGRELERERQEKASRVLEGAVTR